jgi:hypothetical protein
VVGRARQRSLEQVLLQLDVDASVYTHWEITDISADGSAVIGNARKDGLSIGWRVYVDSVFP